MIVRLKKIISNYDDLAKQMSDPNVVADIKKYTNLA